MKRNHISALAIAVTVAVLAGTWGAAQTTVPTPAPIQTTNEDSRIGKILEQNARILKNQDEILKQLAEIKQEVTVLKFRVH